jgi:hypothetical protein
MPECNIRTVRADVVDITTVSDWQDSCTHGGLIIHRRDAEAPGF